MFLTGENTIERHVNEAMNCLQEDGSFAAMAHKNEALMNVNGAFEILKRENNDFTKKE